MAHDLVDACREAKDSARPKITNQDIIDGTGISESAVKKFMSGGTKVPSLDTAAAICKYLDVSIDDAYDIAGEDAMTAKLQDLQDALEAKTCDLTAAQEKLAYQEHSLRMHRIVTMILLALLALVVIALIADLLNTNAGWIRRARGYLSGFLTVGKGGVL
nr:MAG TPA: Cro/C1-type HTH DNA-binding domain protein [Caudoviricetes sp.]